MRRRGNPGFVRRQRDLSNARVVALVTSDERDRVVAAAAADGVSVSEFVRRAAMVDVQLVELERGK